MFILVQLGSFLILELANVLHPAQVVCFLTQSIILVQVHALIICLWIQ